MEWLEANWQYIIYIGIPVIIAIANAVTKHYSESKGLSKALLFVVDVLDILRPLFKPSAAPKGDGR